MIHVTLFTRPGCHLCAEMNDLLGRVLPRFSANLEIVDVDGDPDLARTHGEEVPVLCVNGRKFAKFRVSEAALRFKLMRESWKER